MSFGTYPLRPAATWAGSFVLLPSAAWRTSRECCLASSEVSACVGLDCGVQGSVVVVGWGRNLLGLLRVALWPPSTCVASDILMELFVVVGDQGCRKVCVVVGW